MKGFKIKRGEKGFTLVELLIVVAILGILAAVVIPNVVGLMGRGGAQAYKTDNEVIQLGAAAFYSDVHGGWVNDPTGVLWGCNDTVTNVPLLQPTGHYYPTALAAFGSHKIVPSTTYFDVDHVNNFVLMADNTVDNQANSLEGVTGATAINAAAIWMGLLVNAPGDYEIEAGYADRGKVSALLAETGLYLQSMPKSSSWLESAPGLNDLGNGNKEPGGGYTWIVGKNGSVYGAYLVQDCQPVDASGVQLTEGDYWFAGFSGAYP